MRFTLLELIVALTLFAIGIPAGWHIFGFCKHQELTESAQQIGTNVVNVFRLDPETGTLSYTGPPLPGNKLSEVARMLFDRNKFNVEGASNVQSE